MRGGAVVPGHRHAVPDYVGLFKERFQRGTPRAFQWCPAVLTRLTGWRWRIQGGVQAQSGDQGNGFAEGLAAVEQIQYGVAVVSHQHQGTFGQPATQLHDHLPRPVGDLLVPASLLLVIPRRGCQHREHRQRPMASRPGDVSQPHQGDPAQPAGLDQLAPAGTHRVAIDGPRPDLGPTTSFQGFVDAEDQRTVATVQVLEQEHQEDVGHLTGRPRRPIEHLMIPGVVPVVAQSHDTERRCHGALAGSQDRADQQQLCLQVRPGWAGEQRREGNKNRYNRVGQGEHRLAFFDGGPASLPCSYNLSSFCAKSSLLDRTRIAGGIIRRA